MNIEDVDPRFFDFKVGDWVRHRDFGTALVIQTWEEELPNPDWTTGVHREVLIFIFKWNITKYFDPTQMEGEFICAVPKFDDIENLFFRANFTNIPTKNLIS